MAQPHRWRTLVLVTACVVLIGVSLVALFLLQPANTSAVGIEGITLPGQQRWMQGGIPISSYLFGTTDLAQEAVTPNIETSPAAQQVLKSAGITIIRTDFPNNATDAQIDQRLQTISNAGAACLGTIVNPANTAFDVHLVQHAGAKCPMWEIGLSPDTNGVPVATYVQQWKTLVPLLRQATTAAPIKLMGPATATENHPYLDAFLQGAKAAKLVPDALTYHWFPCMQLAQAACLAQAASVGQMVQDAKALMQNDLGVTLPIGITAWNAQLSPNPAAYVTDPAFITPFTVKALIGMEQAGVAVANQVAAASGAGGGRLDMISVQPVQAKAQLVAMMTMIMMARCTPPGPMMSPTTGTPGGTPTMGMTPTPMGTMPAMTPAPQPTATASPTATGTAVGTMAPSPTATGTVTQPSPVPSTTVQPTPTTTGTACPGGTTGLVA